MKLMKFMGWRRVVYAAVRMIIKAEEMNMQTDSKHDIEHGFGLRGQHLGPLIANRLCSKSVSLILETQSPMCLDRPCNYSLTGGGSGCQGNPKCLQTSSFL